MPGVNVGGMKPKPEAAWPFITDSMREMPGMEERRMFGCLAFYREGLLTLILTGEGEEPWNGVMVATDRAHHASLIAVLPVLRSHPVLGKWLYVSSASAEFEASAEFLVNLVRARDLRVGVAPKPKRARRPAGGRLSKKQKSR